MLGGWAPSHQALDYPADDANRRDRAGHAARQLDVPELVEQLVELAPLRGGQPRPCHLRASLTSRSRSSGSSHLQ